MNRRSVILVVLIAIVCAIPIPGQTANRVSEPSHHPKSQADNGKAPSQPTVALLEKNCDSDQFKNSADCKAAENKEQTIVISKLPTANITIQGNPKRDGWDWVAYGANLALACVGLAGIGVGVATILYIKRQVYETAYQRVLMRSSLRTMRRQGIAMEKQTQILADSVAAAQKSADAAVTSAQAAMGIAVPTLILQSFGFGDMGRTNFAAKLQYPNIRIAIKNFGQTPALLNRYDLQFFCNGLRGTNSDLTCRFDGGEVVEPGSTRVLDGINRPYNPFSDEDVAAVESRSKTFSVCGQLFYRDIFGSPFKIMAFDKDLADIGFDMEEFTWVDSPNPYDEDGKPKPN